MMFKSNAALPTPLRVSAVSTPKRVIDIDHLFSEENQDRYTGGEGYRLAHELQRIAAERGYNWTMVAVVPEAEGLDDFWVHIAVLTDKGVLLDIDGSNIPHAVTDGFDDSFLNTRWGYSASEMYERRTGIRDHSIKPKLIPVDESRYQLLISGQSTDATDDNAAVVAEELLDWYEQSRAA